MMGLTLRPYQRKKYQQVLIACAILGVVCLTIRFGINTELECFNFCLGKGCFSSRLTILVYRDNVTPSNMDFLQDFRPELGLKRYITDVAMGRYDGESCSLGEHGFTRFKTIPRHRDCAVVGNGGILTHSKCGNLINSHEYVIRINLAPLIGYEKDVGYKTNLTLLNFETLVYAHGNLTMRNAENKHEMYLSRVRYLNDSVLWYSKSMGPRQTRLRLQQTVDVLKTRYKLPLRIGFNWRPLHSEKFVGMKRLASSGFDAYYVAKSFCDQVTLYGFYPFSKDARGYRLPHHYYEDVFYEYSNNVHNMNWEFKKYQEYAKDGALRIVTEKCETKNIGKIGGKEG